MRRSISVLLAFFLSFGITARAGNSSGPELFDTVFPFVTHLKLKSEQIRAVADKQVIARSVPTKNDKEMASVGVVMADALPDAFVESYRSLATFQQNPYIIACGKFGATPALKDLEKLAIDEKDLYALVKSNPRESDIKLSEPEMKRFRAIAPDATRITPQLKARIGAEFKQMIVERVKNYIASGGAALGIYSDKEAPINAQEAFVALSREQAESSQHYAHMYSYMESYPQNTLQDCESFIYWAKQRFGDLKPVINVVHVMIHKDGNRTFIVSKQLYSTHYTEAALSVAELIPFTDGQGLQRTIVIYTIRMQVDMLGGTFGFMKKRMAHPRVLATLRQSLGGMRTTMEATSRAQVQTKVAP